MDQILKKTTGQNTDQRAVAYIAEGNPLFEGITARAAYNALLALPDETPQLEAAQTILAKALATSELDSSAFLVGVTVPSLEDVRAALCNLSSHCDDEDLSNLAADAVIAAQRENNQTMSTLTLVAGISYSGLDSFSSEPLPRNPHSDWTTRQVRAAFDVINDLLSGPWNEGPGGVEPTRPVEFYVDYPPGTDENAPWARVAAMLDDGVPYELLLVQRSVAGGWSSGQTRWW